jgi:hypothetical protein
MTLNVLKISDSDMHKRFENICKELFMKKYNIKETKSFINQQAIETLPITFENEQYAFQCKYVDKISSALVDDLKKGIDYLVSKKDKMPVHHITYYLGFTPGESKEEVYPKFELTITEYAATNNIETDWVYGNMLETQLESLEHRGIYLKYIEPIYRQYLLTDYQEQISSSDLTYFINRKVVLKNETLDLYELIKNENIIYLLSDAGVGKTTQVKWLVKNANEDQWHTKLIRLKAFSGQDLSYYFKSSFFSSRIQLVVFDGFDELNPVYLGKFNILLDDIQNVQTSTKIVITSRKNFFSYMNPFGNDKIAYLEPISTLDIQEYINRRVGKNNELYNQVKENRYPEYFSVPFFLKHTVDLFESGIVKSKLTDMLNELLRLSFSTVDIFVRENILHQLEVVAIKLVEDSVSSISIMDVAEEHRIEILRFQWIEYDSSLNIISFKHNSYKEFLVALNLSKLNKEELLQILAISLLGDFYMLPKYTNILPYILDINDNRDDYLRLFIDRGIANTFNFELNFLDNNQKLAQFIKLTAKSISRKTWYDTNQVDFKNLSNLINSKLGIQYLMEKLSKSTHRTEFTLYLSVIQELPIQTKLYNFSLRDQIISVALNRHKDGSFINRIAISALQDFTLGFDKMVSIIEANIYDEDSTVRHAIYDLISKKSLINELIVLIFNLTGFCTTKDKIRPGYHDITEGIYFTKFLERLSDASVILEVGKILLDKHLNSYSNDYLNSLLSSICNLDENEINDSVLNLVYNVLSNQRIHHYTIDNKYIQKILNIGNNREKMYKRITSKLSTYDDFHVLSYIIDPALFYRVIGMMEADQKIEHFKIYFVNVLSRLRSEKEIQDAIAPYLYHEQKQVDEENDIQVLFDNLFTENYLKTIVLSIFDYFIKDSFMIDELLLAHDLRIDHDIKMIFNGSTNYLYEKDKILLWDYSILTNDLIIYKISSQNIKIKSDQKGRIESIIGEFILPDLGMSEQTITSTNTNSQIWMAGYVLYKFGIRHPDKDLIKKLLSIDVYDRSTNEGVEISFYEKYIDVESILSIAVGLINSNYFKNRHSLSKRVEYLSNYCYPGVEDYLLKLLLDKNLRTELYDLKKTIVQYFHSIDKICILVENVDDLDDDTFEYLLESIDIYDDKTDFIPMLVTQLNKDNHNRVSLSYKSLFNIQGSDFEDLFVIWIKTLTDHREINESTYYKLILGTKKLETMLVLLDLELKVYEENKESQRIHVITNKISQYFLSINNKSSFEKDIKKYVELLESSKYYISSFFFTYIDNIIIDYLKRL